ncbi:MAG: group II intron maturase-specific domain-containing protein [Acidimicrobiales bacterium]
MRHARDRIRFLTMRARLVAPVEQVVAEGNRFLRGWAGYFRFGNSAWTFDKINDYAVMRTDFSLLNGKRRDVHGVLAGENRCFATKAATPAAAAASGSCPRS